VIKEFELRFAFAAAVGNTSYVAIGASVAWGTHFKVVIVLKARLHAARTIELELPVKAKDPATDLGPLVPPR
jgi:hypothetical protein